MADKPENPQAFPRPMCATAPFDSGHNIQDYGEQGMTIRDYFAATALPAIIANSRPIDPSLKWSDMCDVCAKLAYIIADDMLEARSK